jgi:hypothetical protein
MKEDEKYRKFIDAQQHPENYTDEELQEFLRDPAIGKLSLLKRACIRDKDRNNEVDMDEAWKDVEERHLYGCHHRHWLRAAALFVGVLLVTAIACAAVVSVLHHHHSPAKTESIAVKKNRTPVKTEKRKVFNSKDSLRLKSVSCPATMTFDDVNLEKILAKWSTYYKVRVIYSDDEVKHVRLHFVWNQTKSLDENIRLLNSFQKISIVRKGNLLTVE